MAIGYYILAGATMLASRYVSGKLQSRFSEYSQLALPMTGAQIAQKMLDDRGITDVKVMSVGGQLTDHYHPVKKTVNLSQVVHGAANVAAAAVAAHEVGHAIQHGKGYAMLGLRSRLVPIVNISSKFMMYVIMAGMALAYNGSPTLLWIGVALFAMTTLFSVVTLPVEFDASRRALKWMEEAGVAPPELQPKAKNALFWAAMTYTVAAIGSIGQLIYFAQMAMRAGRR